MSSGALGRSECRFCDVRRANVYRCLECGKTACLRCLPRHGRAWLVRRVDTHWSELCLTRRQLTQFAEAARRAEATMRCRGCGASLAFSKWLGGSSLNHAVEHGRECFGAYVCIARRCVLYDSRRLALLRETIGEASEKYGEAGSASPITSPGTPALRYFQELRRRSPSCAVESHWSRAAFGQTRCSRCGSVCGATFGRCVESLRPYCLGCLTDAVKARRVRLVDLFEDGRVRSFSRRQLQSKLTEASNSSPPTLQG